MLSPQPGKHQYGETVTCDLLVLPSSTTPAMSPPQNWKAERGYLVAFLIFLLHILTIFQGKKKKKKASIFHPYKENKTEVKFPLKKK